MKRSPLKRTEFKRKPPKRKLGRFRKPLRNNTPKRAAKNRKAAPVRQAMCELAGRCDMCCHETLDLCAHEIPRANLRVDAFDKAYATLILCDGCHKHLHAEPAIWTKAKQAGLLKIRRPEAFDLVALNVLLIARIDAEEIEIAVKLILNPKRFDHSGRATA